MVIDVAWINHTGDIRGDIYISRLFSQEIGRIVVYSP